MGVFLGTTVLILGIAGFYPGDRGVDPGDSGVVC